MIQRHEIRELLVRTEKARKRILQPEFSSIGLTLGTGHAKILNCLGHEDRITQRTLADRCQMDVTTLSRALDRLEEAGLVTRERDPGCRRSFLICLTDSGREKSGQVHEFFVQVDDQIWAGFSQEEMEVFYHSLMKICENLEGRTLFQTPDASAQGKHS